MESWIEVQLERLFDRVEAEELLTEGAEVLDQVAALTDRAEQIKGLRAAKGKDLSPEARANLQAVHDQLAALAATLTQNRT